MPLSKLWNSIRGRSTPSPAADKRADLEAPLQPTSRKKVKSGGGFGLFGGGPHAGLCKLVKSSVGKSNRSVATGVDRPAFTVLEISVGDGTRAVAMLETIAKFHPSVRYLAIDQFELGDGGVTLKSFHQKLRTHQVRPRLFPEATAEGLIRVAHNIGTVDLVVIAASTNHWRTSRVESLLSRISTENTVVLYQDDETDTWSRWIDSDRAATRIAA